MNQIKSSAKLIGEITMGVGNYIGENVVIIGPVTLGDNNFIADGVIIGHLPQDDIFNVQDHVLLSANELVNSINIGSNNIIREYVTVHKGALRNTLIGDSNYIMTYSNIAHDCIIENSVKIASNVNMGGFCIVQNNSYLGMSGSLHQFTVVGAASMVGMGSVVLQNILPATTAYGVPAKAIKPNSIGLRNIGVEDWSWWKAELDEISISELGATEKEMFADYVRSVDLNVLDRQNYSLKRDQINEGT